MNQYSHIYYIVDYFITLLSHLSQDATPIH